jgi:nicotinate-nucleotide adenylyltransferase
MKPARPRRRGAAPQPTAPASSGPHGSSAPQSRTPVRGKRSEAAAIVPRYRIPPHSRGQRIGLFGGTFDPPHKAHLAASLLAMKRLALDQVWWLVTPGNPLKDTRGLAPLDTRVAAARALAKHPRIHVTGLEAEIGVHYTFDTIRYLVSHCRGVHFVWIMGADNLRSFHRWQRWRGIAKLVPIVVVDRLGPSLYAVGSVAAQALGRRRIPEGAAASLPTRRPPAWVLLHGLKSPLSSTALRAMRQSQKRLGIRRIL